MKIQKILLTGFMTIFALALAGCQESKPPLKLPEIKSVVNSGVTPSETVTDSTSGTEKVKQPLNIKVINSNGTTQQFTGSPTPSPAATPSTDPKPPFALAGTKGMAITKDGFTPNKLTIKAGTTVMFSNQDTAEHWPASGNHPTHQVCPGFDALKGLKQGEVYSFKFENAGTCPMHDHLNPTITGEIIVE